MDGVYFRPLVEVVHDYQKVSVPILALWDGSYDVDSDPLEQSTDVILEQQAPASGRGLHGPKF
jgi:hypothetical protein